MNNWCLRSILVLLGILFALSLHSAPAPAPVMQIKVYFESKAQLMELRKMNLDQCAIGDNYIEVITSPLELEGIQGKGFRTKVVHDDLVSFYQSGLDPGKDMGGYMTLSEINAAIDNLVANHPDIVSAKHNLGQTIEGRDMWAIKISDNPNIDEEEAEVLFTAATHAREVITPMVVLNYANYMVENYSTDPQIQNLVDNREIWIVPCVNPDGYYYNEVTDPQGGGLWRKNRRENYDSTFGVDLNRNFGYKWGYNGLGSSDDPGNVNYRGTEPFSEPEIQNMRDFHIAHNIILSVYFHSYGTKILWPYGWYIYYTADHDLFQAMGDSCAAWNGYTTGTIARTLYYVNGGSDDWLYGEQTLKNKTFAFTFEVGSGSFWPPIEDIPDLLSENLNPMIYLTEIADHVYQMRPSNAPSISVIDSAITGEAYTVSWNLEDTANTPVAFEIQQLNGQEVVTDSANNFDYCLNDGFSVSTERSHSGLSSFYGGMDAYTDNYIQYDFPFEVQAGDSLIFYTWYEIELDYDYAYVEVSTDGDNFASIPGNLTTTYDPHDLNRGHGITGSSGGWVLAKCDLGDYVGENIIIRLLYSTDTHTLEEGIYFDDIFPVSVIASQQSFYFSSEITSYQFSQFHSGTYRYRIRAKDTEEQWSRFSPPDGIQVYRLTPYICGDANGDDGVNISDAVYIINFIFIGGSAPDPLESADVNCDYFVNVSDAVYILNHIFIGGHPPCDMDDNGIPDCQ